MLPTAGLAKSLHINRVKQTQQPNVCVVTSGNFNHVTVNGSLPSYTQYVDCHTSENKTLVLCMQMHLMHTAPLHLLPS